MDEDISKNMMKIRSIQMFSAPKSEYKFKMCSVSI